MLLCTSNAFSETFAEQRYAYLRNLFTGAGIAYDMDWHEKNGLPSGVVKGFYDPNGPFKGTVSVEITFEDGLQNGPMRGYTTDGKLWREINYKDGKEDGIARTWNIDGKVTEETTYTRGVVLSRKNFHPNGNLSDEWTPDPYNLKIMLLEADGKTAEIPKVYEDCYQSNGPTSDSCGLSLIMEYKNKGDYLKAIKVIDDLIPKFQKKKAGQAAANDLIKMRQDLQSKVVK